MVRKLNIEEAAQNLASLVSGMNPDDEIALTMNTEVVGRLLPPLSRKVVRRVPGSAKGTLHIIKEDDEHLEDFKEYM